jgi:hypothetical protein
VDHGLAQIFRAGFAVGVAQRNLVRDAIVGDELRVFDGKVGGPLLEVAHGVTLGVHHLAQQLVGASDRRLWTVDEIGLDLSPAQNIPIGLVWT